MSASTAQRERYVASCLRRFVDPQYQLEGLAARAAIGVGLGIAAKNRQDVPIVALVPEAVNVRRVAVECADELVIGVAFGERPVLDLVHRRPANLNRPLLSQY